MLHLRCPECEQRTAACYAHEAVAEYDRQLMRDRAMVAYHYQALVRHNMEELVATFSRALALDLIGPDDFAPGPLAHGIQSP